MYFLTTMPLWASGLILVGLSTCIAMIGPAFVRKHVSLARLSTNNEVAGFKFATVGVLYAVLVAFAIIVVWEKFDEAEMAVAQEASAAVTMHRLASGISEDFSNSVNTELTAYVTDVIERDWPVMARAEGFTSRASGAALSRLYGTVMALQPQDRRQEVIQTELLRQLETMTTTRRTRGVISAGIMPNVVWWVLLGGATLTIGFTFFFGTQNLRAQTLMAGMLSILIFSALLIIIAIDYPFSGPVHVTPHAFERALAEWTGGNPD